MAFSRQIRIRVRQRIDRIDRPIEPDVYSKRGNPLVILTSILAVFVFYSTTSPSHAQNHPAAVQPGSTIPENVGQLLVGVADTWDQSRGKLWRYQRDASTREWQRLSHADGVDILLGRNGLAWGRGALAIPESLQQKHSKREGDGRAPAGCFAITKIYGNDASLPAGANFPYRQVGAWDAWPDDIQNPFYNRHIVIDPQQGIPTWFEKQRMRQGDFAYRWLVEIRHNADPPQPGAGSAIFFHIRRGPDRRTSGCTTMSEGNLKAIVSWLKIDAQPHYVLLPKSVYQSLAPVWKLPPLAD